TRPTNTALMRCRLPFKSCFLNDLDRIAVLRTRVWNLKRRNAVGAHIGAQGVRYYDRTVGLLIVFHDRDPSSAHRQTGTVQSVHEVALPCTLALKADSSSPRLKSFAVRAGGNLHKFPACRQPRFDVIGLGRSKPRVAGTELHDPVMNSQLLEQSLRVAHQAFQ